MKEQSIHMYKAMWTAFCGWLDRNSQHWSSLTANDISLFLKGPAPSNANRRRATNPSRMSDYTRQRYWRLLSGILSEAVRQNWLTSNPASDLQPWERPSVVKRARQSQILPPGILQMLQNPDTLRRILPKDDENNQWTYLRDRAILATIAHTGVTTSELISLCGSNLRKGSASLLSLKNASQITFIPPPAQNQQCWLDICDKDGSIQRSLPLPEDALQSILPWLSKRQQLLHEHAARTTTLANRATLLNEFSLEGPLFPSRQTKSGPNAWHPIKPVSVYWAIDHAFEALYNLPGMQSQNPQNNGLKVARGGAIIRNSLIRHWLDTQDIETTLLLAGLKNASSLRLLPKQSQ